MAPKNRKPVEKKVDDDDEQKPEQDKKSGPPLKKAKKEPDEKSESKDSIGEKKELDKMYQAMKYQDKKGNKHPLEAYNKLTTKKEKADFYAKFLKDKKFEWVAIEETTELKSSNTNQSFQGWCSKWQVADHMKMPADHPLLIAKLASLPSRAHALEEWRDAGEMEYYYTSNQVQLNTEEQSHGIKVQGHGTAQPRLVENLLQGLPAASSSQGPHKAIEDGSAPEKNEGEGVKDEKEEDEEETKNALLDDWNELKGKLQKATRSMGDLCMEAQTTQGALGHKTHLEGLVKKVRENLAVLEPAKQKALEALGLMNTITVKDTKVEEMKIKMAELGQLHEECVHHIEAFKCGAFKEAKILLKSM